MTTDLEKQFFSVFGIEKIYSWKTTNARNMYGYKRVKTYPQITDKHYLELLKLLMLDEGIKITVYNIQDESKSYKEFGITCLDYFYDEPECDEEDYEPIQSTGTLEDCILKALILIEEKYKGYLKHQVQAIFEGER